jgi:Lanthionine-containing peptide SapB precursor RamS
MALLDIQSMNAARDNKCDGGGGGGGGFGVASGLSVLLCDSIASILVC